MNLRASILGAALFAITSSVLSAPPPAEIVSVQGKGQYSVDQQASWRPAAAKQPLLPTNYVRTLDLSKMAILLPDRTQMDLGPNSLVQITGPEEAVSARIPAGRVWGQAKAPPKRLVLETPAALAAIRGTDWEIFVDNDGHATLSVFSGEVEFYNDQGNVLVRSNEQARAEKGRAPVKLQLNVSRVRIQWVSSFRIDPDRYPELRSGAPASLAVPAGLAAIAAQIREQNLGEAYARVKALAPASSAPVATLLLADFEVYRGESAAAKELLERAATRFPTDERFDVALARIALMNDDIAQARTRAQAAVAKRPGSADGWVMVGDIERLDGRADDAIAAYSRAAAASAAEAAAWKGIGIVESERENVGRARSNLAKAIALDPVDASARAELGTLEGFAGNLARGRAELEKALASQPDNYVALTGLGVLEIKAGNNDAAIDALLRASLIEPRYARAHLYLAAAHYQAGHDSAALAELKRAAELDPKDPLPHLLASIIHLDRIEPGRAVEEARLALERIPFLKSLNQVADNQKGVANVGAPLASMGLEAWARSAANQSYLPFWGGSHLFLADRYPGAFNQRSELMQGYVTDPIAFGASNRFQSLYTQPGYYGTASLRYSKISDLHVTEPVATLNGYDASHIPFAYFAEAIDTRIDSGISAFNGNARTYTVAAGAKPTHEAGVFVYANRLSIDVDLGVAGVNGDFNHVEGTAKRIDGGLRYAPDARASLWLKAGASEEDSFADETVTVGPQGRPVSQRSLFSIKPKASDVGLRYTLSATDRLEVTAGLETARESTPQQLLRDSLFHLTNVAVTQDRLDEANHDRSDAAYAVVRWGDERLRVEAGAAWRDYRRDRDIHVIFGAAPGADVFVTERYRRRKVDPMAGIVWRFAPEVLARATCRRWLRPIALDTLAPIAIAGVALDDQLVFSGGELEQCRAHLEWAPGRETFSSAYFERARVRNLVSPLDGVQNTRADVTNLDRLRNRTVTAPAKPDRLEDTPIYGEGIARRAVVALERIVTPAIGARLHYIYTDSENSGAAFKDRRIPYLARHQANLGATWAPGWRTLVTAQAVYRTRRYADEANLSPLPAGWDAQVSVFVESPDKRWSVEAYAAGLLKKETSDVFGAVLSYRF
jgi:tetratricopeptide (TPR) repeat protein